jgi:hypothetical protein
MSIPINQLVYAGIWSATTPYPQFQFVESPIDTFCYVNVDIQPSLGGPDPSVQPSTVWVLLNVPSGSGITSLNGLTASAMSITSTDASVSISPVAPDKVDLSVAGTFTPAYGGISNSSAVTIPSAVATLLSYDTLDSTLSQITVIVPTTSITLANAGVYKVQTSIQVTRADPTPSLVELYLILDGADIPNTTRAITTINTEESVLSAEWFINVPNPSSVLQSAVYSADANNFLPSSAASPFTPARPSVITTILRIA